MIIQDRSFPHPVLTPLRDDVTPNEFDLEVKVSPDADNYYIDVALTYTNETLSEHIASDKATHAVHFECRRNFFREVYEFKGQTKRITIPTSELPCPTPATDLSPKNNPNKDDPTDRDWSSPI